MSSNKKYVSVDLDYRNVDTLLDDLLAAKLRAAAEGAESTSIELNGDWDDGYELSVTWMRDKTELEIEQDELDMQIRKLSQLENYRRNVERLEQELQNNV